LEGGDDDSLVDLSDEDLRAQHFKSGVTDVLDEYLVGDIDLAGDLVKRLKTYAQMYTNSKGPGMLFIPLDDDPDSPVKFQGIITASDFQDEYEKHPLYMFNEVKRRALLIIAYQEQSRTLYKHCLNLSGNIEVVHQWADTIIQNYVRLLQEQKSAAPIPNSVRTPDSGTFQGAEDMAENLVNLEEENDRLQQQIEQLTASRDEAIDQSSLRQRELITLRSEISTLKQRDAVLKQLYNEALRTKESEPAPAATLISDPPASPRRRREVTPADTVRSFVSGLTHSANVSANRSSKQADPPIFYNDDKEDKMKFEPWFRNLKNKLKINSDHYRNDTDMRMYIEGRIGGKAADNLEPYLRDGHPDQITTTEELLLHLWQEYADPRAEENAVNAFEKLAFKKGGNYKEFRNDFVRLAGERQLNKDEWKREFKRKLFPGLQAQLAVSFVNYSISFRNYVNLGHEILSNWDSSHDKDKSSPPILP